MTREELLELARALVGTTDDLEVVVRELGYFDTAFMGYDEAMYELKQVRKQLKRIKVYQDLDGGEWKRLKRKVAA